MSKYTPDNFIIVRVVNGQSKVEYRVLGGWSGGYLNGDSWRINSGIKSWEIVDKDEKYPRVLFYGYSGSVYDCFIDQEGERMNMCGIPSQLVQEEGVEIISLESFMEEFSNGDE